MNKKLILGIILGLTITTLIIVLVLNHKTRYNKLIISNDKWNKIISDRNLSTNISLEKIELNDYSLIIDNENNVIYYSIVDSSTKYNPSIKYQANKKVSIAINKKITDESLEETDSLKIIIYNNKEYKIYSLVITSYPTINIIYNENTKKTSNITTEIQLFDNHVSSPQRVLKSDGKLKIISEDQEYSFSLTKESVGHNKRENYISVFGMEKRDEYIIKKVENTDKDGKYVRLFLNNEYKGIYSFGLQEGRRIDNFERNKESNK